MGVRDVNTLAQKAVVIVNTDVAASQTVADRYCAMYGIPTTNQFTYAMGTDVLWEYTADRFSSFWTDLYNKVQSVGAYAVFTTAGCPLGIELLRKDGTENGAGANFSLLVGFVKRIISTGYEPRIHQTLTYPLQGPTYTNTIYSGLNPKTNAANQDATAIGSILKTEFDAELLAAGGDDTNIIGSGFTTYRGTGTPNFASCDNLLTGHIGYYTTEATHPATLWDLSRVILGKAGNLQKPFASHTGTALVAIQELSETLYTADAKQALVAKRLIDAGIDVTYWYVPTFPTDPAEALLPLAGEVGWNYFSLDPGPESPTCTYTFGLGFGFENGMEATWNSTMIPATTGGVFCGGKSYGDAWGKQNMVDAGHSYVAHMGETEYGYHQSAAEQCKALDIWLNLIAGRSLAEAAWCSQEYSFLAVGDPLCRPFPT